MGSPFWSLGFRPFFLGAGLWACLAVALWLAALAGAIAVPSAFAPAAWHAHEMIFGFAAAVLSGFALTAVPEWTGRAPVGGGALAALLGLWAAGRVAVAVSAVIGPGTAALIDGAYLAVLCGVVGREIVISGNRRNLVIALAIGLLFVANALTHLEGLGGVASQALGLRLGLAVMAALITLVGGRITPAFTGNWLARGGGARPPPFGWVDRIALGTGVLALALWVAAPDSLAAALVLLAAAAGHGVRLARWRGTSTGAEPLVWVLHLGYAWVVIGLALLGLAHWLPGFAAAGAAHGLGAGAIGTMTVAVMTRATLGHTGRALTAGAGTAMIYLLVTAGAAARIAAGLLGEISAALTFTGGALWIAGFGLFCLLYGPMQLGPRIDQDGAGNG